MPCGDARRQPRKLVPGLCRPVPPARHGPHSPSVPGTGGHRVHGHRGPVLLLRLLPDVRAGRDYGADLLPAPPEHRPRRAVHMPSEPRRVQHAAAGGPSDRSRYRRDHPAFPARPPHGPLQPGDAVPGAGVPHPLRGGTRHAPLPHSVRPRQLQGRQRCPRARGGR